MRLLLDSHVVVWAFRDPARMSAVGRDLVEDPTNELVVSAATAWELSTKARVGQAPDLQTLLAAYPDHLRTLGVVDLPITTGHALAAGRLAWSHRDPFDRMLVAQSILEGMPLITADAAFAELAGLQILW